MLISKYIKGDLSARLKSGQELRTPMTIDALAEHYNVSHTPVRSAMAELIHGGLLKKGPNRRLMPVSPRNSATRRRQPLKLPELPRDPFAIISGDLVRLCLQGEPVYLREEATAEKYRRQPMPLTALPHPSFATTPPSPLAGNSGRCR